MTQPWVSNKENKSLTDSYIKSYLTH